MFKEKTMSHYRIWKSGKKWLYGASVLMLTAGTLPVHAITLPNSSTGNPSTNNVDPATPNSNASALQNPGTTSGGLILNAKSSDTSALNNLVNQIRAFGGTATQDPTTNVGTAKTNAEADQLRSQIGSDYAAQEKTLQAAIDKYNADKKAYDNAFATYNSQLVTAQLANTVDNTTNGSVLNVNGNAFTNAYPNQVTGVDFSSGIDFLGSSITTSSFGDNPYLSSTIYTTPTWTTDAGGTHTEMWLNAGQSVTVTYHIDPNSGIQYKNEAIQTIAVTFTNPNSYNEILAVGNAPAVSSAIYNNSYGAKSNGANPHATVNLHYEFNTSTGPVSFSGDAGNTALLWFGSLNHTKLPSVDDVEAALINPSLMTGHAFPNSTVTYQVGSDAGAFYSHNYNDFKTNNPALLYDTVNSSGTGWDQDPDNLGWYAGGYAQTSAPQQGLSYAMDTTAGFVWFLTQFQIPSKTAPLPAYPTVQMPTPPTVNYHYETGLYTPADVKSVTTLGGTDIDNKEVNKMSEVVWNLNLDQKLTDGRDKTTSVVFSDPLPNGFVIDLDKTKSLSPAYNITYDATTNSLTATLIQSELDKLNADLESDIAIPTVKIAGQVLNDNALYANGFTTSIADDQGKLDVKSNNVYVYTPGQVPPGTNPPDLPPATPPSSNPPGTPGLPPTTIINPVKDNQDGNGVSINGDTIPQDTVNHFTLLWDLDQYKGITADQSEIDKGFVYVDDYQDDAVIPDDSKVTFTDDSGKTIDPSLFTVKHYASLSQAPQSVRDILTASKITVTGAFQIFLPNDQNAFYQDYVQKGNSIHITTPMTITKGFLGTFINTPYQIDFGNGYWGKPTNNTVVPPTNPGNPGNPEVPTSPGNPTNPNNPDNPTPNGPSKDVSLTENGETIDVNQGKTGLVAKDGNFFYELKSRVFQAGRTEVQSYTITDNYDEKSDKLSSNYDVFVGGQKIGNQDSKLFTMTNQNGVITFEATQDMLDKINADRSNTYSVEIVVGATRTAEAKAVDNKFTDNVGTDANGDGKVDPKDPKENSPKTSNTVETNTPGKPETPTTPSNPNQPNTPTNPSNPNTPSNPSNPGTPDLPKDPDQPNNPNNPVNPQNPLGPVKDVEKTDGTDSIDINQGKDGTVRLSDKIVYELESSILKAGRGNETAWAATDDYQEQLDNYLGTYRVYVNGEKLGTQDDGYLTVSNDNGVLKATATDKLITYVNAHKSEAIRWSVNFDFKRAAASDSVLNKYTENLSVDVNNDGKVDPKDPSETSNLTSNEVKTKTPKAAETTPTPAPKQDTGNTDKSNKNPIVNLILPHTGDQVKTSLSVLGTGLLALAAGIWKRKAIKDFFGSVMTKIRGK